ncbi:MULTISPECIES: tape measure protein [Bacteroidales]|uniref:tape measure protein n=1 Tax=Bacteroidales TaxID=171549 RepID=UPI00266DB5FA|nr:MULTISPECIES: tape measure protein [Bacteroidales]
MNGIQGALHFDITGDNTNLEKALAASRASIISSGETADREGARIEQMFKRATSGALAFFSVAKATDFVKSMATVHGEFQAIEIALSTILGSEEKAMGLVAQLKDTAAKTPFDMKGVASGAKMLLAYGESADTVNDTLIKLGNIAAGLSQPLGDIVYLYGTTMTQGRLYTQDLNQFTGRGIPMIRELAKEFGVAESEVKKLVEEGKVGFPEVQRVVENLTNETGMFYNLMERQSAAVTGKISNLEDAWASALDEMGQSSEGFLYAGIEGATYLVEHYETVLKILGTLITAYGSYKAALIAINVVQKVSATIEATRALLAQTQMLRRATQAQILFNQAVKANPYVLAFSALTTLISALVMFSDKGEEAERVTASLANATKKADEEFDKEASHVKSLADIVQNSNVHYLKRKQCLEELQRIIPDYNASLTKEGELLNNNTDAIKNYLIQLERQIKLKAIQEELEEAYKEQRQIQKEWDAAHQDLSSKRTNSAYYDDPIIDISGMFGQRDLQKAEKAFNEVDARLQRVNRTIASLNSEIASTSVSTAGGTTKFKTFAEQLEAAKTRVSTLKGELKDLLAGKGDVSNFAQAIEDKRKEISKAEDDYDLLRGIDPKKKSSTTATSVDYKTKMENEAREIARLYEDLELSIQKSRIDAMEEGLPKILAQNEFNHKQELVAIEHQKQDTLRKLQEQEKTIWESQNPDWKKKGLKFTPSVTELPKDVLSQFDSLTEEANNRLVADNKRVMDEMLDDYRDYEEKRAKIAEDYEKKRKALYNEDGSLREGVSQGNVDELNRSENEALKAVDEEFAQREATYQVWMAAIADMTLKQLKAVLAEAESELEKLEKSGTADGQQLAVARAKVNTARKKVSTASADNDLNPSKRTLKEWEDLYKTLNEVEKEFESIGDTVGGVVGEIISECGKFATSALTMINGIVQLTQMSATSIQGTAAAGATAISTMEKASVILTIISAAMQIAMQIVNLFNNDEEYQKEIEKLQERIDQLQWELDNAEVNRLQSNTFDILTKVKQVYAEVTAEVLKLHSSSSRTWGWMYQMIGRVTYQNEILTKSAEKLAIAYANIEYTADKALGAEKFSNAKTQLENIAKQQLLIQEQIRNEDAKKKTDHGQIAEWERQIQELGEEANKIINEIVEEIIGGSAADLANELGDAFIEAFRAGEDAAEAWGKKVDDIVADVIKRMLVSKYLEEPLGEIFDKYKSKWYKDGEFAGIDAIMESMNGFANDLNSVGDEFQAIWDALPDSIKNLITVTDDAANREASERGIATASQESVDENNGRLTVIQSHTYTMNENVKLLVLFSDKMLETTNAIRENSEFCKKLDKLDSIDKEVTRLRVKLDEISDDGLKVK